MVQINYLNKFRLDSKLVLVSGGLGLIGRETSLALAQAGARVIILDIYEPKGLSFEKECRANNLMVTFCKFDITDLDQLAANIEALIKQYGLIEVWINAAYPRTADWQQAGLNIDSWRKNIDLQLNSTCISTIKVAETMVQNKVKGTIINFGSIYGVVGPDVGLYSNSGLILPPAYAAIKGGIINFTRYAASYFGKNGIRVNTICPGGVENNYGEEFVLRYSGRTPLKRMAKPEEVASAVLFLASEAASYITGITLMVDGGWTCI
ncbi:MAG TPA: SDR family oxidoreductase [Candidatus Nanoarchaeia archaeon]|nr:SDR family oxidoreductase [Candidatus Nanoarchaeia archaeon]